MTAPALAPLAPAFRALVRDRLRARAAAAGLDGLLVLAPGNVTYATGWHFSVNERPMGLWLPVEGDARLLVPQLELENALDVPGVGVATKLAVGVPLDNDVLADLTALGQELGVRETLSVVGPWREARL